MVNKPVAEKLKCKQVVQYRHMQAAYRFIANAEKRKKLIATMYPSVRF